MKSYIFITAEGMTFQPSSEAIEPDVDNCQVIGFARGKTQKEAFTNLVSENGYLLDTTFNEIRCYEVEENRNSEIFFLEGWRR